MMKTVVMNLLECNSQKQCEIVETIGAVFLSLDLLRLTMLLENIIPHLLVTLEKSVC